MPNSPSTKAGRHALALISLPVLTGLALTACGAPQLHGDLGSLQQTLQSCPDGPLASYVALDVTGSSATDKIQANRADLAAAQAKRTLVCGGTLKVVNFSDSSGGTQVLFDQAMPDLPGATDVARLRQVSKEWPAIEQQLEGALAAPVTVSQNGSDIVGQLRLISEFQRSLGDDAHVEAIVQTDGLQNVGLDVASEAAAGHDVTALAQQVNVPDLTGTTLTFAGIGTTSGDPLSSSILEGVVTFYEALCTKTGASGCLVATNLSPAALLDGYGR